MGMRKPGLLAPHRGRLFQILFFVLNRTKVIGRRHVGEARETAQTLIDRVMEAIQVRHAELRRRRTEGGA
jgi:hypothetical protein